MDELRLYARNDDNLEGLVSTVKRFSETKRLSLVWMNVPKSHLEKAS